MEPNKSTSKRTCVYHPWGELVCYADSAQSYGESWKRKPDQFIEYFVVDEESGGGKEGLTGNDVTQITRFIDDPVNKTERYVVLFEQEKRGTTVIPAYGEWVVLYGPRDLKAMNELRVSVVRSAGSSLVDWSNRARFMYVNNCTVKTYREDKLENLNGTFGAGAHDIAKPFQSMRIER